MAFLLGIESLSYRMPSVVSQYNKLQKLLPGLDTHVARRPWPGFAGAECNDSMIKMYHETLRAQSDEYPKSQPRLKAQRQ